MNDDEAEKILIVILDKEVAEGNDSINHLTLMVKSGLPTEQIDRVMERLGASYKDSEPRATDRQQHRKSGEIGMNKKILDEKINHPDKPKKCNRNHIKYNTMKCGRYLTRQIKSKTIRITDGDKNIGENSIHEEFESWWRYICKDCGYIGNWKKFKHYIDSDSEQKDGKGGN